MKKCLKVLSIASCMFLAMGIVACGEKNEETEELKTSGNETTDVTEDISDDDFEWEENIISAISNQGAKQKKVVIPSRCEGFGDKRLLDMTDADIEEVSFESDEDIELGGVFASAPNLKKVVLPAKLTKIDTMEFINCPKLETIEIPTGVNAIGEYSFQDNLALTEVLLDENGTATVIGPHAFDGCSSLKDITFADAITSIGEYAFYKCASLETVTLPKGLSEVGKYAFANSGLKELYVPAEVELQAVDATSFVQADHEVKVYVVEGSWFDQNFDIIMGEGFEKIYYDGVTTD